MKFPGPARHSRRFLHIRDKVRLGGNLGNMGGQDIGDLSEATAPTATQPQTAARGLFLNPRPHVLNAVDQQRIGFIIPALRHPGYNSISRGSLPASFGHLDVSRVPDE